MAHSVISVMYLVGSLLVTPFLMLLLCIVFLASVGKSLGVRRLYVRLLLVIFEFGRVNIESAQREMNGNNNYELDEDVALPSQSPPPPTIVGTNYNTDKPNNNDVQDSPTKHLIRKNGVRHGSTASLGSITSVITRDDNLILVPEPPLTLPSQAVHKNDEDEKKAGEKYKQYDLSSVFDYLKVGIEAIIEDQVTSRFEAEELKNWNLLIRTNRRYEFISWKLTVMWVCGFFVRYFFLFPLRVLICFFGVCWLTMCTALVGYVRESDFKQRLNRYVSIMCFGILSNAISAVITYHNEENKPKSGGICVANHTSPIDVLILMCDNCYSLIGQRHGGFLGILQRALARASPHIWFERSEVRDRHAVTKRLKEHVSNPANPSILIFPEGTCINNTSVMQFKKGSFEVGSVIYPVAIKYDARFGDAFWNSSRFTMMQYLYMMMTSWAIVCEVWYLPPMYQMEAESAIDFANRVKGVIAHQGGLVDLVWDGQLKRSKPKKEWRERQQEEFSKRLKID